MIYHDPPYPPTGLWDALYAVVMHDIHPASHTHTHTHTHTLRRITQRYRDGVAAGAETRRLQEFAKRYIPSYIIL
jgi:hypothetical protein